LKVRHLAFSSGLLRHATVRGLGCRTAIHAQAMAAEEVLQLRKLARLSVLVTAAAVGQVPSARRLESPVIAERLTDIDFAKRVCVGRSGFSVPPILIRDPRYLPLPTVGRRDGTILRDLEFTLAKTACGG